MIVLRRLPSLPLMLLGLLLSFPISGYSGGMTVEPSASTGTASTGNGLANIGRKLNDCRARWA